MSKKSIKKPRIHTVTLDMGKLITANGLFVDPKTGKVALMHNGQVLTPKKAIVEQSYKRTKGPKILNRAQAKPTTLFINPNRILEQYDVIYAIDTNNRMVNSIWISVTGIVGGEITKDIIPNHSAIRFRPIKCFEYRNVSSKPENLGWKETIKAICRSESYSKDQSIAVIVDSDLSFIDDFNLRKMPIYEDYFLPENFEFIYASTDSGSENVANQMLKLADRISHEILQIIQSSNPQDELLATSNEPYTHFRIWEPQTNRMG